MSDIFREVEEDLRHEHYKRLWDKYGAYVLAVAVLIVVGTAGYRGWEAWEASRSQNAGDRYVAALQSADDGEIEAAETELQAMGTDAPDGYSVLARLRAASIKAQGEDTEGALKAFADIAADKSVKPIFQNAARIHAGYILVDTGNPADVKAHLSDLTKEDHAWRHSARELIGLAAFKAEDYDEARTWFQQAVGDRDVPADLAARANIMLSLIQSQQGAAAAETADGDGKAGETAIKNGEGQ